MQSLRGRTAVVTGAASGIGLALANRFADEGMTVVLADIAAQPLAAATYALRQCGAEALGIVTDVADSAAMESLAIAAEEHYGGVDLVCLNAGVLGPTDVPL